jgi:hypothetical protein
MLQQSLVPMHYFDPVWWITAVLMKLALKSKGKKILLTSKGTEFTLLL